MLTEDHILRQISRLAAVLAKVAGLAKAGKFQEAYGLIDRTIEEFLGLNASIVKQLDDHSLLNHLTTQNGLDFMKLIALADLLSAEGDVLILQGYDIEGQQDYQRALDLYREVSSQNPVPLQNELAQKIKELMNKLNPSG